MNEEWNTVEECIEHIFLAHPERKQISGCSKQIPLFKPLNGEQNYTPISYAGAKYCMIAFRKQESQLNVSSLLKNIHYSKAHPKVIRWIISNIRFIWIVVDKSLNKVEGRRVHSFLFHVIVFDKLSINSVQMVHILFDRFNLDKSNYIDAIISIFFGLQLKTFVCLIFENWFLMFTRGMFP